MAIYEYKGLRPNIGEDCYSAESAEMIGNVSLGEGIYVGPEKDRIRTYKQNR